MQGRSTYPSKSRIQNSESGFCKISIIGPESTGKSTLCTQLAEHYNSLWCPEYAREYLVQQGMDYTFDDLLTIAQGQLALEDEYTRRAVDQWHADPFKKTSLPLLFIDTDMYVMKVWCEYVFNRCHPYIIDQIVSRRYDLYLLCNTDLPWVKDELREYPDLENRRQLYLTYKDILVNQDTPWVDVYGEYDQRLLTALQGIRANLPNIAP